MKLKSRDTTQPKVMVILGDGGHSAEILQLVNLMGSDYEYYYVMTTEDEISENKLNIPGPVYRIKRPRAKDDKLWQAVPKLMYSFLQALKPLKESRPDVVIGSGPAVMVPVALLAKLSGAKIIFIETASRVTELSLTGKIMLRIADLFFVQWEQLQERYPRTVFAGRLF